MAQSFELALQRKLSSKRIPKKICAGKMRQPTTGQKKPAETATQKKQPKHAAKNGRKNVGKTE